MADNDELRLRVVPELDPAAVKKVQAELDKLKAEITVQTKTVSSGGMSGGGKTTTQEVKNDTAAVNENTAAKKVNTQATNENKQVQQQADQTLKEHLKTIRAEIDLQDLKLRTIKENASNTINSYREMAAAGSITSDQLINEIRQQLDTIKRAEQESRQEYLQTKQALEDLTNEYGEGNQAIINRQKQLQSASDKVSQSNKGLREATELLKQNTAATQQSANATNMSAAASRQAGDALKNELKDIRARIDAQDLNVRSVRANAEREIEALQQRAAAGQITTDQMNQGIIAQQTLVENAEAQARAEYIATGQALENLSNQYGQNTQAIINRNKQLFYANERLESGFNSMSGSMQKVVSNTKNANLAFMNFGRIVQDAPFGLIGIANNIDPMLVSFQNLKNEVGGTGLALKALGKQLLGPAGLIFLLGSALPSALLFLQSRQREAGKEANTLAEALKRVADEFGRLSAQAASKRGIAQVNEEFEVTVKTLDAVSKELDKIEKQINEQVQIGVADQLVANASQYKKELEEQNKEILFGLRLAKQSLEANKQNLDIEKQDIEAQQVINRLKKEGAIAESLSLSEIITKSRELLDLQFRALELIDPISAQIQQEQQKINGILAQLILNTELMATESGKKLYNDLRNRLATIADEIRATQNKTSGYIDRTLEKQALLKIAYENNLYLAKDENLTWDQRQKYFDQAIMSRRSELDLQIQSAEAQRAITTDEASRIGLNVQLINLREEMRRIDRDITDFAERRAKAALEEWLIRQQMLSDLQEEIRLLEQASFNDIDEIDTANDLFERRFASATEWIDMQAEYEIESYIRLGNRIKALEAEKQLFILQQARQYQDEGYALAEARMMAESDAARHYTNAERDMRKEVNTEIFQAIGDLASNALTAIFGDSKGVAIAQVIIDTIMGIQKIWAQSGINPIVGGIASAALAAKGVASIQKIRNTEVGSNASPSAGSNAIFVNTQDVYGREDSMFLRRPSSGSTSILGRTRSNFAASEVASSMSDRNLEMMGNINISANVDRRGLAIAVREGERNIRSQQFDYR